jgi:hypothetical protein
VVASEFEGFAKKETHLLVVTGRSRRLAVEDHHRELKQLMEQCSVGSEVTKTIGEVATAFVVSGCKAGVVVMQAAVAATD